MEKIKIKISISRSAAIAAGHSRFGEVEIDVDPGPLTVEQRTELASIYRDATRTKDTNGYVVSYEVASVEDFVLVNLLAWRMEHRIAAAAEQKKEDAAQAKREMAALIKIQEMVKAGEIKLGGTFRASGRPDSIEWPKVDVLNWNDRSSGKIVKGDPCEEIMKQRLVTAQADWDEARAKKETAEKAKEVMAATAKQIEDEATDKLIRELLGNDELDRYDRGFFSEADERDLLRGHAWSNRDENLDRYERLRSGDVAHESEYCGGKIEFSADILGDPLTADQFAKLREIEEVFADSDWSVEPRCHVAECNNCDSVIERLSVLVSIRVGKYTLSREYTL